MSDRDQRTRLTYLINAVDYGGAEVGMVRLLSGLPPDRFEVTVITLKGAEPKLAAQLPSEVTVHELNLTDQPTTGAIRTLFGSVRRADVLVGSLYPSVVLGAVFGTMFRVPRRYTWKHNTSKGSGLSRALNRLSFRLSDAVLVDSAATRELVIRWGTDESRTVQLPISGIDTDSYPTATYDTSSPVRIGTVGSLTLQKGYPELLKCAERLPKYEFHVIGSGPLREDLEAGPDNVVLHGTVSHDELLELRASFDVYFQPSRYEGLCITAIEAMGSGLPVVASAVDGLTESVVDGETGYLVGQGDIDGYCDRLEELADDHQLRAEFGSRARTRVEDRYSQTAFVEAFTDLVEE